MPARAEPLVYERHHGAFDTSLLAGAASRRLVFAMLDVARVCRFSGAPAVGKGVLGVMLSLGAAHWRSLMSEFCVVQVSRITPLLACPARLFVTDAAVYLMVSCRVRLYVSRGPECCPRVAQPAPVNNDNSAVRVSRCVCTAALGQHGETVMCAAGRSRMFRVFFHGGTSCRSVAAAPVRV